MMITITLQTTLEGVPHGAMANVLDCDILASEFELPPCDYHTSLEKDMNPFILPSIG